MDVDDGGMEREMAVADAAEDAALLLVADLAEMVAQGDPCVPHLGDRDDDEREHALQDAMTMSYEESMQYELDLAMAPERTSGGLVVEYWRDEDADDGERELHCELGVAAAASLAEHSTVTVVNGNVGADWTKHESKEKDVVHQNGGEGIVRAANETMFLQHKHQLQSGRWNWAARKREREEDCWAEGHRKERPPDGGRE